MELSNTSLSTCLWFDSNAEEAANFYTGIFPNSSLGRISRYGKEGFEHHGKPEGSALMVEFSLDGRPFMGLNGGPVFQFNESISFVITCKSQEELDYYWDRLIAGGSAQMCGWLKDQFGVSWQVVPSILGELMSSKEPGVAQRVSQQLFTMQKLDFGPLLDAAKG